MALPEPTSPRQRVRRLKVELELRRPAQAAERNTECDLCICLRCHSDLVQPVAWAQHGEDLWRLKLRCPECGWRGAGIYTQGALDRFDEFLDQATEAVMSDLARLSRANMEEQIERFVAAIEGDLILPEDF